MVTPEIRLKGFKLEWYKQQILEKILENLKKYFPMQ